MDYTLNNSGCQMNKKGCCKNTTQKLAVFDWMCDLPETVSDSDFVEVQFKNTRKGYYLNSTKIELEKGDVVAVEAMPGHDIGEVTLVGRLVVLQMKKNGINPEKMEIRRVYRKARENDIEKYNEAKAREHATMIKSRQIADDLKLNMKIGDVEFQGDGNKAIFYYIADERVDFRQLIKVLAEEFKVRIEMRQIGSRQEAGRIGGIGPCGRELCCSSWLINFTSVSTNAARIQDLSLNPQKLAGQCAKLKCCINYESDVYQDATKDFPSKEVVLETIDSSWFHFKTDVFKREMTYSSAPNMPSNLVTISVDRVHDVIAMNKTGQKPEKLSDTKATAKTPEIDFQNVVGQDSLTRFDRDKKKKGNKPSSQNNDGGQNNNNQPNNRNNKNKNRQHNQNQNNQSAQNNNQNNNRRPIILKKKDDNNEQQQ